MAKFLPAVLASCIVAFAAPALADSNDQDCKIGPISKTYGGSPWLVYGCNDGHSVIVITAPGSPASPFLFAFHWEADGYHLSGVGTGNKKLTDAAFADLKVLSGADIEALFAAARSH